MSHKHEDDQLIVQHSIWSQGIPNNEEENAQNTSSAPSPLTADPRTPSKNFPAIYTFLEIKPASTSYKLEFLISVPVRGCRPPVIGSILFCPRQPSLASSKQSLFNTDHQLQLPIGFVLEMHSVIRLKSQLVQFARFVIDQQWGWLLTKLIRLRCLIFHGAANFLANVEKCHQ